MSAPVLLLFVLDFAYVGALPFIFFKKGAFNLRWMATAAPFVLNPVFLFAVYKGWIPALVSGPELFWLEIASVPFACFSIAMIAATMAVHRIPLALWHQEDDAPRNIVTWGPYALVRHPFYSAFLVGLLGAVVLCPHWGTGALFFYEIILLTLTARREERRLGNSEFGAEYQAYAAKTGRFIPRLFRNSDPR